MGGQVPIRKTIPDGKPFDHNKIESCERVVNGNQMIETCKNGLGNTVKVSIFIDRNGNGKFEAGEATSVKYYTNLGTKGLPKTVEYRDIDGDGISDEIETKQGPFSTIEKESSETANGQNHKMDFKYGFKWDAGEPGYGK